MTLRVNRLQAAAVALAGVCLAGEAAALPVYVDQTATFRYINASAATAGSAPANWFMPGFDDSNWYSGTAPFADRPTNATIFDTGNVGAPFAPGATAPIPASYTYWQVDYDPYLRTTFTLTAPTALTVWVAVDNGINSMYFNGVLATAGVNAEGNAFRWEHVFDIGAQYTVAGTNTFALQLEDHGGATGFVMMITADNETSETPLTTNPPPPAQEGVPAPGAFALLGLGLASLAARRRK